MSNVIQHPSAWPRPELLQSVEIGQINAWKFCVIPITNSAISKAADMTISQSAVHLRVVSETGGRLTQEDLDKAALEPIDLQKLCQLQVTEDRLRLQYLGVHAVSAKLFPEHCFVDEYGEVHVTFILCTRGFRIPPKD